MEHLEHLYLKKNVNYAGVPYAGYQSYYSLTPTERSNIIRTNESCVKSETIPCEYSITFTNKVSSKAFSQDVDVVVPTDTEGRELKLFRITIADMQIELRSSAELKEADKTTKDYSGLYHEFDIYDGPILYMSDGSIVKTESDNSISTERLNGGMIDWNNYIVESYLSYDISGAVNTENIVKIEWNGVTIWEK